MIPFEFMPIFCVGFFQKGLVCVSVFGRNCLQDAYGPCGFSANQTPVPLRFNSVPRPSLGWAEETHQVQGGLGQDFAKCLRKNRGALPVFVRIIHVFTKMILFSRETFGGMDKFVSLHSHTCFFTA